MFSNTHLDTKYKASALNVQIDSAPRWSLLVRQPGYLLLTDERPKCGLTNDNEDRAIQSLPGHCRIYVLCAGLRLLLAF